MFLGAKLLPVDMQLRDVSAVGALVPVDEGSQPSRALIGGAVVGDDDAEVCANIFK